MSFSYTVLIPSTRWGLLGNQPNHSVKEKPMPENVSRWGTVREAAEISGFHTMTIRRYIKAGDLPARRVGVKLIQVDLDAVRAMVSPIVPTVTRIGPYASNGINK